jgi:hypothetical protein
MNEEGFFFKEHSEYGENSTSFKENNWSPQYKLKLISKHEEFHSYSNDNSDSPNIPTFKVNGENEKFYKYIIGEGSISQFDKNKENENNNKNNSTRENSNENKESNIEKVSQNLNIEEEVKREKTPKFRTKITTSSKPSYWRFDYAKKYWKSKITQNLIDCINEKISNSDLPIEYKNKIHKPNSLLFTANVKESDNCDFLEKDNRAILTFGKENNEKQKHNDDNISEIYEYFEKIGYNNLSDKMLNIKNLLEMTYEEYIKTFYESDEFTSFKNEERTRFYDEGTKKQEGFTISENLGLIKIFRRKRKREHNN